MSFKIISAKLTGNPDSSGWAQVYEFEPQDQIKFAARGKLYAVISTFTKEEGVDRVLSGREILSRLHEEYFGNTQGNALSALKEAVNKVLGEFSSWDGLEIGALSCLKDAVYLVAGGGAEAAILRDEDLVKILESGRAKPMSASGHPQDQDVFLIAASTFFNNLSVGEIKAALSSRDLDLAVESLAPKAHSLGARLGAVFMKFERKTESLSKDQKLDEPGTDGERVGGEISKKRIERPAIKPGSFNGFKKTFSRLVSRLPSRGVYIKEKGEKLVSERRKLPLSVGVILISLLIVSIVFGIRQKEQVEYKARYQSRLDQAVHELNEAYEIYPINSIRARELFVEAQTKVLGLSQEGISDPTLDELKKNMQEREGEILGVFREDTALFVDLSLLSSEFQGDIVTSSDERIFVLDKQGKKIIGIVFDTKRSEVVAGPSQIDEPEGLASHSERVFIINSKGVFEVGENFDKLIEVDWEGEVLPFAYAGNFYILEKSTSTIWRYAGTGSGFLAKSSWLAPGIQVDLSQARSLVIDGVVWILTESGRILKFNLGNPQRFSLTGVFSELTKPVAIYTNEELEYLYILDNENNRVVVVNKNGEYKAQYVSDAIKEAKALVVSEKEKKVILLTGGKLISVEIKHL